MTIFDKSLSGGGLTTLYIILGVLVVGLFVVYILLTRLKKKAIIKGFIKDIEYQRDYSKQGKAYRVVVSAIESDRKYDGSFKSLSSDNKRLVKKYIKNWLKDIPEEVILMRHFRNRKCRNFVIFGLQEKKLQKETIKSYLFDSDLKTSKSVNEILKLLKKVPATLALIKLLNRVYLNESNIYISKIKDKDVTPIFESERGYILSHQISSLKKVSKASPKLVDAIRNPKSEEPIGDIVKGPDIYGAEIVNGPTPEEIEESKDEFDVIEEIVEGLSNPDSDVQITVNGSPINQDGGEIKDQNVSMFVEDILPNLNTEGAAKINIDGNLFQADMSEENNEE